MSGGLVLVSATGNRFALFDGLGEASLADPAGLARELGFRAELGLDGLLQVLPPRQGGDCRMVLHNTDGSRSAACGNGLRCVAAHVLLRGYLGGMVVVVETDAGPRTVEVSGLDGRARARSEMGDVRIVERALELELPPPGADRARVAVVDAGNPHCVLFVDDVERAPVRLLGPVLENHPRFPDRTNVSFVEAGPGRLRVRVWERGVGETRSCGTGATAAACVAVAQERAVFPVRVDMTGGSLVVLQERGAIFLEGEVEVEARRFLPLEGAWLQGGGSERSREGTESVEDVPGRGPRE